MMNVVVRMVGVPRYVMTHPQVTFAPVAMDTRSTVIDSHVMVSYCHLLFTHLYHCTPSPLLLTDIDECTYFTPCSQHCHNTEGNYTCSCIDGFVSDGQYCVNNSGELLATIVL